MVAHDEATPTHEDVIINMMAAHEWLVKEFGEKGRPKVGWDVDSFGHSNINPRVYPDMGIDAWFFARMDPNDRQ